MQLKLTNLFMIIFLAGSLWGLIGSSQAADNGPLAELHHDLAVKRLAALQPVLTSYQKKLDELSNQLEQDGNIEGLRDTQQEKGLIAAELIRLSQAPEETRVPETKSAIATPAPPPVAIKRDPKVHISSVQGLAGAASFSENNVYQFTLPDVGATSTLTFYATGRRSTDSVGNVWLVSPAGEREKVARWKGSYFEDPAIEVKSYQKMKPITEDISKYVQGPGTYQVEFEWTDGIDPLVIYRVEITS